MFFRSPLWEVSTCRSPRGKAQNLSYSAVRKQCFAIEWPAMCWNWYQRTVYSPSNTTKCIPRCWTWYRHWWCLTLHAMAPSQVKYRLWKTVKRRHSLSLLCPNNMGVFLRLCLCSWRMKQYSFMCIYLNLGPVSQKNVSPQQKYHGFYHIPTTSENLLTNWNPGQ